MPPPSPVSLRQLEYFVAVAENGTIAAAAKVCRVSQSAISVAISQMESNLNVDVFQRAPSKRLTLTQAGHRLVVDARRIVAQVDDFAAMAHDLGDGLQGELLVGTAETLSVYLLPRLLGEFGGRHPELGITFLEGSVEQLREYLAESVCEVAITYWPTEMPGFTATPLFSIRPHVILPPHHRLAQTGIVRLADLVTETAILLDSPPSAELFLSMFRSLGLDPEHVKRVSNMETLRALVAGGAGYAPLLNRHGTNVAANGCSFAAAEIAEPIESMAVYLVVATAGRLTNRAQEFAQFCLESFRTHPPDSAGPRERAAARDAALL
ncbi:MAG: LysR family transcriptional regulator [Pseudoclavibacter sp.]